jgi:hypothetical protein
LVFDGIGRVGITDNGGGIGLRLNFIDKIFDKFLFDGDGGISEDGTGG